MSNGRICTYCGTPAEAGVKFCVSCGAPLPVEEPAAPSQPAAPTYQAVPAYQAPAYQQPAYPQTGYQPAPSAYQPPVTNGYGQIPVDKKTYIKTRLSADRVKEIRNIAIFGYVLVGIQILMGIFLTYTSFIDALICTSMLLGFHLGRSKGWGIAILVYGVISMIIMLASTGTIGGWAWIIVGICAINVFKKIDKEYTGAMTGGYMG